MSFAVKILQFAVATPILVEEVARRTYGEIFTDVIRRTPVDTGLAVGNWIIGDQVSSGPQTSLDPSRATVLATVGTKMKQFKGGTIFLSNKADHILELEYGKSRQAPTGMVRLNEARFYQVVDKHASVLLK